MLGLLPLREAPTTVPPIPQLLPPRFMTRQQMHKHCSAQATSQYQTVTSVPECQHCFNRDSIFNFILTTHDIFCLDFDRDPEGWEVPTKQIHKKSFIWKSLHMFDNCGRLSFQIRTSGKSRYSASPMSSSRGIFRGADLLYIIAIISLSG